MRKKARLKKNETRSAFTYPLSIVAIAIACIAAYATIFNSGFLCDDFAILYGIEKGSVLDIGSRGLYFRPIAIASFALDWHLFGDNPAWFHSVNIFLHILTSLGVMRIADLLIRRPWAGLIAGLAFAIHPVHPEAVTWVAGRFDVLCGALLAWSFALYINSETGQGTRRSTKIWSIILFGIACLVKEQAFVFPLAILLYELFPALHPVDCPETISLRIKRTIPFLIMMVILFAARWIILGNFGAYIPEESKDNLLIGFLYHLFWQPFVVLLMPVNWSLFENCQIMWIIAMWIILLLPVVLILFTDRKFALFCILAIFINVLPTAHLGIAGGALQNSRFLYVPSIFHALLISSIFTAPFRRRFAKVIPILMAIFLAAFFLNLQQNNYPWQKAGYTLRSARESTKVLVDEYSSEWGISRTKLLAFNVPEAYIGAWLLKNGLREMLKLDYPSEMENVEIEVIHGGLQTEENIRRIENAEEGTVVWIYEDATAEFAELRTSASATRSPDPAF